MTSAERERKLWSMIPTKLKGGRGPVGVEELQRAVHRMIAVHFAGRELSWDVATMALHNAADDIRQGKR